jgi:hypothetical protein
MSSIYNTFIYTAYCFQSGERMTVVSPRDLLKD